MAQLNDGRVSVDVSVNKTLTAADSGIVQNVIADGLVITLPSTALGNEFIIRNGGVGPTGTPYGTGFDGSVGVTVTPQAADGVTGNGFTAAVAKGPVNTKATSTVGDEIRLSATGVAGVTAWVIGSVKGTWSRLA